MPHVFTIDKLYAQIGSLIRTLEGRRFQASFVRLLNDLKANDTRGEA